MLRMDESSTGVLTSAASAFDNLEKSDQGGGLRVQGVWEGGPVREAEGGKTGQAKREGNFSSRTKTAKGARSMIPEGSKW